MSRVSHRPRYVIPINYQSDIGKLLCISSSIVLRFIYNYVAIRIVDIRDVVDFWPFPEPPGEPRLPDPVVNLNVILSNSSHSCLAQPMLSQS